MKRSYLPNAAALVMSQIVIHSSVHSPSLSTLHSSVKTAQACSDSELHQLAFTNRSSISPSSNLRGTGSFPARGPVLDRPPDRNRPSLARWFLGRGDAKEYCNTALDNLSFNEISSVDMDEGIPLLDMSNIAIHLAHFWPRFAGAKIGL